MEVVEATEVSANFLNIFDATFKKCSYPQIRNVFAMYLSESFIASCSQARRISCAPQVSMPYLRSIIRHCPYLEVLENFYQIFWTFDTCNRMIL